MYCCCSTQRVLAGSLCPASRRSRSHRSLITAPVACCHHAWGCRMTGTCSNGGACVLFHLHSKVCSDVGPVLAEDCISIRSSTPVASRGKADSTAVPNSPRSGLAAAWVFDGMGSDARARNSHDLGAQVETCNSRELPGAAGDGIFCAAGSEPRWRAVRGTSSWPAA